MARIDEFTGAGGIAPVEGPPIGTYIRRKKKKKPKSKARSAISGILGEDTEEAIIPGDAIGLEVGNTYAPEAEDEGSDFDTQGYSEPLMDPTVALVAPDCTPKAFEPVDRSRVPVSNQQQQMTAPVSTPAAQPQQSPAMDTLLGRPDPAAITAESLFGMSTGGAGGGGLLNEGQAMPEPSKGDPKKTMAAFGRFVRF